MLTLIIVLVIVAALALLLIGIYNGLVSKRQACRQGWADIDAQLRQRHDLIPNLVEAVKGYAAHERETLDAVISARNKATAAKSISETQAAENALGGALGKLFALAEGYPDLKANTNFLQLQNELADVEDKLAASRRAYNAAAARYNASRESFPAVLFANGMGFSEREFWELEAASRDVVTARPEVSF